MVVAFRLTFNLQVKDVLDTLIQRSQETAIFGFAKFNTSIHVLSTPKYQNQQIIIMDLYFPFDIIFPNLIKRFAFWLRLKQIKYKYSYNYIYKDELIRLILDKDSFMTGYNGTQRNVSMVS